MGHTTKPCLSFPRLFYLSVYGSTEGLDTRGGGLGGRLGLLISGGYRPSNQANGDLEIKAQSAQLPWCQMKYRWIPGFRSWG